MWLGTVRPPRKKKKGYARPRAESKQKSQKSNNNERKRTMERVTWLSGLDQVREAGAGSRTYVCMHVYTEEYVRGVHVRKDSVPGQRGKRQEKERKRVEEERMRATEDRQTGRQVPVPRYLAVPWYGRAVEGE